MSKIKKALLDALEEREKATMDECAKKVLVSILDMDKNVFDAMTNEVEFKRKRGRPRKDEISLFRDNGDLSRNGLARKALIEEAKRKARRDALLNPQPTKSKARILDLEQRLREIGWDIGDAPDSREETARMGADMENLRKEAGMKKLNREYKPYAKYQDRWTEYLDVKKDAVMRFRQAATFLKEKMYDELEVMLKSLEKFPERMTDRYNDVVESYEECCASLCDEIDRNGNSNGSNANQAKAVEKQGIGMLNQEGCKEYIARMKALKKSKEIPDTIRNVDEIVAQTERRWKSVAGIGNDEFTRIKDNFRKTIELMLKGCSFASNMTIQGVEDVLNGTLPSILDKENGNRQKKHGILGGRFNDIMHRIERKCFGNDEGDNNISYGCLHSMIPNKFDMQLGSQYGGNVIRWKKYMSVTTMLFGDSLSLARDGLNYITPCLATNPSPSCFDPENRNIIKELKEKPFTMGIETMCHYMGVPYCELQFHGCDRHAPENIESISFATTDEIQNLSAAAIDKIVGLGILTFIGDMAISKDELVKIHLGEST